MSCQLIVCTIRHYFDEFLVLDDSEAIFSDFTHFLSALGIEVNTSEESEEFLCEDLHSRPWLDLLDVCAEHSAQHCLEFQQSVFLPIPKAGFNNAVFSGNVVSEGDNDILELHCGTLDGIEAAVDFIAALPECAEWLTASDSHHRHIVEAHRAAIWAARAFSQPIFTSA
jgi:hypothetical protein